jgi:putative tryptophan/tyrosine transport system substrate-binding protein
MNVVSSQRSVVGKIMCSIALCALLFALSVRAEAQQTGKIPRIGFLVAGTASAVSARVEAFRQGLRERGYVEGKNIVVEYRYGDDKVDRLSEQAAELVRLKVNVIVSAGSQATRPAKEATTTIPIIMAQDNDPVGSGFIASLAKPGGNITGLANLTTELSGKQLELLKEIMPKLSRLAVLRDLTEPGNPQAVRQTDLAAQGFGIQRHYLDVKSAPDIEPAFLSAGKKQVEALLVMPSALFNSHRKQIVELVKKNRWPAMYPRTDYVEDGGLMTYGANTNDLFRRAAIFVDKILKGAKPANLPVEQPVKFDLMFNLQTAKQIGLTIPPNVLARADKVIK